MRKLSSAHSKRCTPSAAGGAMQVRRLRDGRTFNDTMCRKLDEKALTDKQIEDMALSAWADIVENTRPVLKGAAVASCTSEAMEPWNLGDLKWPPCRR